MARMRILALALGHYLQGEAWPDLVERLVVEHDFAIFYVGLCSLLARQGMASLS